MRYKLLVSTFLLSICLQKPVSSYAWGAQGHRIIVEMAFSLLDPAVKQRVLAALDGYPIDDAATWMDSVRINNVNAYKYMREWHFLNMDSTQSYDQVASHDDVVYNLDRVMKAFKDPTVMANKDSLRQNLKILFHLMGDISQPLHCGYGSDIGGNSILVHTAKFNVSKNNLHHVWDDIVIEEGKISVSTSMISYQALTTEQKSTIVQGSATDWMLQARSYLVPDVYHFTEIKNGVSSLSLQYLDDNVPIVQQQLVYAAVRLANTLQSAFGS
jgi:hypothetical protein